MQRGHKIEHLPSLEMPARFDPSGIPCLDGGRLHSRTASSNQRHPRALPGLAPKSVIATVEVASERGEANWLIWGSVGDRPVLFSVAAAAGAEMLNSVAAGETTTAIVEPWQLLLERLD
jgi:hypothetical protein